MGRKRFPLNQFDTTACPFVEKGTGSQHQPSFPSLPPFYNILAAQIVQSLKPSCPGMTLTAAIPFRGQADRFKPGDRMVYDGLMASADEVIILSEYYYTRCFLDRDEFMVENASLLIAFYDGREKGHGGMETDATISDETDRNVEMMKYGKLVKYR